jgi:hypothetical protein
MLTVMLDTVACVHTLTDEANSVGTNLKLKKVDTVRDTNLEAFSQPIVQEESDSSLSASHNPVSTLSSLDLATPRARAHKGYGQSLNKVSQRIDHSSIRMSFSLIRCLILRSIFHSTHAFSALVMVFRCWRQQYYQHHL